MNSTGGRGLEPIESASVDELRALQLERMKWSVRHAYENVDHYRKKFDEHGVHPDELRSLEDLAKFPFTVKQDLRESYPFKLFAVPMDQIVRIHASSGTTGRPTVVGYTKKDIETWAQVVARSIYAAGGRRGDRVHVAYGYGLFTGGLGAHYGAERLGCAVIPMGAGQTEKQVQLIRDFTPRVLMVTPSYCLNIVEEMERQSIGPVECSLQVGIFGAEPWTGKMREEIEHRMGIKASDIYGLSEVMGPGVAQECVETQDGPTVWEDHFYPEIIDPESGKVLPDGEDGELVFTSLTKEALPIVRYRTRDLTKLLPPSARTMRRMGRIAGRCDDMLIIRGVNVFPTQIEVQILKMPKLAPQFQIHVERQGNLDAVAVNVEMRPEVSQSATDAEVAALANELRHRIKTIVGISTRVAVLEPDSIERSVGKAKRVVDHRPKE